MIYRQSVNIPSSNKIIEHVIEPCIKCGCDNIKFDEYEDNYGFISTAKCTGCKREAKANTSISGVIIKWNDENNITLVIADRERLIKNAENEIKALRKLLSKRKATKQKI